MITIGLADGRELSIPTSWSARLAMATTAVAHHRCEISQDGLIVVWPEIDEHIGVWTFLGVYEDAFLQVLGTDADGRPLSSADLIEPFSAIPDDPDCTHRHISSYQTRYASKPVAFWTCTRCGQRFIPVPAAKT